eukprot:gene2417-4690_t
MVDCDPYDAVLDPLYRIEAICEAVFAGASLEELSQYLDTEVIPDEFHGDSRLRDLMPFEKKLSNRATDNSMIQIQENTVNRINTTVSRKIQDIIDLETTRIGVSPTIPEIGDYLRVLITNSSYGQSQYDDVMISIADHLMKVVDESFIMSDKIKMMEEERCKIEETTMILVDRIRYERHNSESKYSEISAESQLNSELADSLRNQLEASDRAFIELKAMYDERMSQDAVEANEIASLTSKVDQLECEVSFLSLAKETARSEWTRAEEELEYARQSCTSLEATILQQEAVIQELNERCISLEELCGSWQAYSKMSEDKVAELEQRIATMTADTSTITMTMAMQEQQLLLQQQQSTSFNIHDESEQEGVEKQVTDDSRIFNKLSEMERDTQDIHDAQSEGVNMSITSDTNNNNNNDNDNSTLEYPVDNESDVIFFLRECVYGLQQEKASLEEQLTLALLERKTADTATGNVSGGVAGGEQQPVVMVVSTESVDVSVEEQSQEQDQGQEQDAMTLLNENMEIIRSEKASLQSELNHRIAQTVLEAQAASETIHQLLTEKARLEEELTLSAASVQMLEEHLQSMEHLEAECATATADTGTGVVESTDGNHWQKIANMEETIGHLEQENESLKEELRMMQTSLDAVSAELTSLHTLAAVAVSVPMPMTMTTTSDTETDALMSSAVEVMVESNTEEMHALRACVHTLQMEKIRLEEELHGTQLALDRLNQKTQVESSDNDTVEILSRMQKENTELGRDLNEAVSALAKIEQENQNLLIHKENLFSQLQDANTTIEELSEQLRLQEEKLQVEELLRETESRVIILNMQIDALNGSGIGNGSGNDIDSNITIETLRENLLKIQQEKNVLSEQVNGAQTVIEVMAEQLEALREMESEIVTLRESIVVLEDEKKRLQQRLVDTESAMDGMTIEMEILKRRLTKDNITDAVDSNIISNGAPTFLSQDANKSITIEREWGSLEEAGDWESKFQESSQYTFNTPPRTNFTHASHR